MRQLRYACLLHDAGKIGVRENVLCKASKLPSASMEAIRERFNALGEKRRGDVLAQCIKTHSDPVAELAKAHTPFTAALEQAFLCISAANTAGFLPETEVAKLRKMHEDGWINADEFANLSIQRGNLNEDEWEDMRSHVTKSYRMLEPIPWPEEMKELPEVAYSHHEKYDGSGYPRKLIGAAIPFDGQIMCVADIYDALTAADRPYKKAIPHERAMKILMEEEAGRGRLLKELVELFFSAKCYLIGAQDFESRLMPAVKTAL